MLARNRPKIVCICGSTRFKDAFARAQNEETLAGRIVLTVGSYLYSDDEQFAGMGDAERRLLKAKLDTLHLFKIDMADEILVLNVGGYIGESVEREIEYAKILGKPIVYLEGHRGRV